MKVIFLDVDGVLNTSNTFKEIKREWQETGKRRVEIDIKRVGYLKEIVDATGALIVLSSSWRKLGSMDNGVFKSENLSVLEFIKILDSFGLYIYDITPRCKSRMRQDEIMEWLKGHDVDSFVVIDDDSYDLQMFLNKELIKTSFTMDDEMVTNMDDVCGLCEEHVDKAIQILNKNMSLVRKNEHI